MNIMVGTSKVPDTVLRSPGLSAIDPKRPELALSGADVLRLRIRQLQLDISLKRKHQQQLQLVTAGGKKLKKPGQALLSVEGAKKEIARLEKELKENEDTLTYEAARRIVGPHNFKKNEKHQEVLTKRAKAV